MKKLLCTRTASFAIAILVILAVAGCKQPIGPETDVTAPTVTAMFPDNADSGVAINSAVIATFSEAMDPATIVAANFALAGGTTPAVGVVSYSEASRTATFTPESNLMVDTVYTATISVAVKDLAGNAMAEAASWTFTTGAAVDAIAPTVISMVPISGMTDVALNGIINATFSEAMAPESIIADNFFLKEGSVSVAGSVSYDVLTRTAIFTPTASLSPSKEYTAAVGVGVKDLSGKKVLMTGFMLPIDEVQNIKEFLLVQSLWSCCYGQPPDIHGIVRVVMPKGKKTDYFFDPLKLTGTFKVEATIMDGYCVDIYQLHIESLEAIK